MELFKINAAGIITNKAGVPVNKDLLARIIKAAGKSMETAPEKQEAPIQTKIEGFEHEGYKKFMEWINKWASRVGKMKEGFTLEQYLTLMKWKEETKPGYSQKEMQDMLLRMHNYKDLNKNVSAFLTLKNWVERNNQKQ